jgi:hypothetical protein
MYILYKPEGQIIKRDGCMKNIFIKIGTILIFCNVLSNADLIQFTASGTINNLTPNVELRGTDVFYTFQFNIDSSASITNAGIPSAIMDNATTDYFYANLIGGTLLPEIEIPQGWMELNIGYTTNNNQNVLYGGLSFSNSYVSLSSSAVNISRWDVGTHLDGYERSTWAFSSLVITEMVNLDAPIIVEPPVGGGDTGNSTNVPESPIMWMMILGIGVLFTFRRKLLPA